MTALPLVYRELRIEARRRWNYWLRLLAGVSVTCVFVSTSFAGGAGGTTTGWPLFIGANFVLYYGIWLIAPLLTADCISREKREGTLALLALTPLTPHGIVIGKSAVHLWRAASFLLAAAPVIALALLMGGVSGTQLATAGIVQFSALALAMVAGLFASAWTRQWIRSAALAALVTFVLWTFHSWVLDQSTGTRGGFSRGLSSRGPAWGGQLSLGTVTQLVLPTFVVFGLLLLSAQRRVRLASADESLSNRRLWWLKTFCRPLPALRKTFRLRSSCKLDRNPIGWLQQYSWSARLTKWGWCAVMIVAETASVANLRNFATQQLLFVLALALGISFAAAGSFRRERQTGALELILVSPLQVNQIVIGRLNGIWGQFLPAALVIVISIWFTSDFMYPRGQSSGAVVVLPLLIGSYLYTPVVGLYYSLKGNNFLLAWLFTFIAPWMAFAIGCLLATLCYGTWSSLFQGSPGSGNIAVIIIGLCGMILQAVFALSVFGLLHRDLSERNFPLEQHVT